MPGNGDSTVSPKGRETRSMTTNFLERPGGRRIAVHDLTPDAPADAPVVLLSHAAPGAGTFDPDPAATASHGVRLIGVDRPGYGSSDPIGDAFAGVDVVADDAIAALESVLPAGATAGVAGWSAGGRVAAAVAARRPDLVQRVVMIGTPAPDEDVPWYPEEHRAGIDALRGLPAAEAHAALSGAFAGSTGGFDRLGAGPADEAVLAGDGVAERLTAMLAAADAQGVAGIIADVAGYTLRPWGFDPVEVQADVLLGYGAEDFVGPAHGEWWAKVLPYARLEVLPDVGHLLVVPFWGPALGHLAHTAR
jgi:pimeloyl-ACP methyl ester carboxylesterase